jgi:hypothetical protein
MKTRVLPRHWKQNKNQRSKLDEIAAKLGIELQEDWYSVTSRAVKASGGGTLIKNYYRGSLYAALKDIYPEFEWNPFQFYSVPKSFQKEKKHMDNKTTLDAISAKLGIKQQSDWYSISRAQVIRLGGEDLLSCYKNSLSTMLSTLYPQFIWNPLSFTSVPRSFWRNHSNQRKLMDWIGEQLNIEYQEDWYSVDGRDVKELGAASLLSNYYNNSFFLALKSVYKEFDWSPLEASSKPHNYLKQASFKELKETLDLHLASTENHQGISELKLTGVT